MGHNQKYVLAVFLAVSVLVLVLLSGLVLFSSNINSRLEDVAFTPNDSWGAGAAGNPTRPQSSLVKKSVTNAQERQAVCNDGSAAVYYYRPGIEQYKDKWVIWLEGGGSCHSEEGCLLRRQESPNLTTSVGAKASLQESGIFSVTRNTNQDFYGWNHVILNYCSSDTWIGDAEQVVGGELWQFRGKKIVKAIIEDLTNPQVTPTANLGQATEVIFAGSSAGGGGAAHNLDDVSAMLPWAEVSGMIDSSWGITLDPYQVTVDVDPAQVVAYQNRTLDASCILSNGTEAYRCNEWEVLHPFIDTRVFYFINQKDHKKLESHGVTSPYDTGELNWVNTIFRPVLLDSFNLISTSDGLYSPNLTFHTIIATDRFFQPYVEGISTYQAFGNWYFGRSGPSRLIGQ